MEEQDKIRFRKFLIEKAVSCNLTEAQRDVFLVDFDPDTQNWDEQQRADKLAKTLETYRQPRTTMYNALGFKGKVSSKRYKDLGFKGKVSKRKVYFLQLSNEFSESPSEQERKRLEIEQLNSQSQFLLLSHDQLGALLAAIKAANKLQEIEAPGALKMQTVCNLWEVLYKIRERNRFHGYSDEVCSISFSPDGQIIASASKDEIRLWHKDGSCLKTTQKQKVSVRSTIFSPNGRIIAFAGIDNSVKLWYWEENRIETFPKEHSCSIYNICFSPNGDMIASASYDGIVKIWNLKGEVVQILGENNNSLFQSVSFSPDGKTLVSIQYGNSPLLSLSDFSY
jgi:WD40 repeat protein